jgi:phosphatidylserine/phosphatidylglycerophosphate/cardiolipin synthase-like enzyme
MLVPVQANINTKIPGFGEAVGNSRKNFDIDIHSDGWSVTARKITLLALPTFVLLLPLLIEEWCGKTYAMLSLPVVTIIASVALVVIVAACIAFKAIHALMRACNPHAYRLEFQPKETHDEIPEIGKETAADIIPLDSVRETFEWKKNLVRSAENSIEISLNYAAGTYFREFLIVLRDRLKEKPNLKCHMLVSHDLLEAADRVCLKKLKKDFPQQFEYLITEGILTLQPTLSSEDNHVKLMVVDGKYFTIGGSGISQKMCSDTAPKHNSHTTFADRFLKPCFRDFNVIGSGDVAKTMRQQFFSLYRIWEYRMGKGDHWRYFSLEGSNPAQMAQFDKCVKKVENCRVKFFVGGPEHRHSNPIRNAYVDLIKNSENKITISNYLFNPHPAIKKAIKERKKGVVAEAYLLGRSRHKRFFVDNFRFFHRQHAPLFDNLYEVQDTNRLYHSKLMVVDDSKVILGNYNLGQKSDISDYEAVITIDSPEVARRLSQSIESDKPQAKVIDKRKAIRTKVDGAARGIFWSYFIGWLVG